MARAGQHLRRQWEGWLGRSALVNGFARVRRGHASRIMAAVVLLGGVVALDVRFGGGRHRDCLYLLPALAGGIMLPLPASLGVAILSWAVENAVSWRKPLASGQATNVWADEAALLGLLLVVTFVAYRLGCAMRQDARQARTLKGLRLVSTAVLSALDSQRVLDVALSQAQRLTRADPVAIWLLDREEGVLSMAGVVARASDAPAPLEGGKVRLGSRHPVARCLARRATVVAGLQAPGPGEGASGPLWTNGASLAVAVPLMARGLPVGALMAGFRTRPEADTLQVLGELGNDVAIAIDNARLYEEAQRASAALERWGHELERRVEEKTRALQSAQEELLEAERLAAIGRLAATVAHELRNPLNVIRVAHRALSLPLPEDRRQRHLDAIGRQVAACSRIIDDLLSFARQWTPQLAPVAVGELLRQVVSDRSIPDTVGVEIRTERGLPPVLADGTQLALALDNLIENAVQAMPEGGRLVLHAAPDGQHARITVADTGPGIPDEVRDHLFEPFFTTKTKGTGLGLAVVRRIVDAHGGRIGVESPPGGGARFTLVLPLASGVQAASGPGGPDAHRAAHLNGGPSGPPP